MVETTGYAPVLPLYQGDFLLLEEVSILENPVGVEPTWSGLKGHGLSVRHKVQLLKWYFRKESNLVCGLRTTLPFVGRKYGGLTGNRTQDNRIKSAIL
jgi:hypothetical protein